MKAAGLFLVLISLAAPAGAGEDVPLLTPAELETVEQGSFPAEPPPNPDPSRLTVTCWNIGYGKNYGRILNALALDLRADVYLLQEVDRLTNRTRDRKSKRYRDLAALLARKLGLNYAYGIEFQELKQDGRSRIAVTGQEILSVHPLSGPFARHFRVQLADWSRGILAWTQKRNGGRMLLYSQVDVNGWIIHLYNTHLESRAEDRKKLAQMEEILEDVDARVPPDAPVIIAGDLNTRESERSPVIAALVRAGFTDPLLGRPLREVATNGRGDRRIDWVFSRNLATTEARIAASFHGSDHRAVTVVYDLSR